MRTIGFAGVTAAPAMPDQQMTEERPELARDEFLEIAFDFFRRCLSAQAQTLREPRYMGIDDNPFVNPEGITQDDIGSFASNATQLD